MPASHLASNPDLPFWAPWTAVALAIASLLLLLFETLRRSNEGRHPLAVVSGIVALLFVVAAVLRPVRIAGRETVVGPRVVVLVDSSRSMALPSGVDGAHASTRADLRDQALRSLGHALRDARATTLGFSDGPPAPLSDTATDSARPPHARGQHSDLGTALRELVRSVDERPAALVVVSDGRLDDIAEGSSPEALRRLADVAGVPIHTVATTHNPPKDASIRKVEAAGAAVAHVPLPLRVEVGCSNDLQCDAITVTARELREQGSPILLASGTAHVKDGRGTLDLTITLDRAGARILEVALEPPDGDTIQGNDRRFVTFNVARERVRVLHVAGRPTLDVRALRRWLKSDTSIDLVTFFILRTPTDDPRATPEELALIPFPVDELFTEHLSSFDAVILQDFDAQPYGLERHLPALARYVRAGGGLLMVGGPNSFVAGGYADTPLADVLPVALDRSSGATAADMAPFTPAWSAEGRTAPLLAPLRTVVVDALPSMPGANVVGDLRSGAAALWTHPTRTTPSGKPMPILAITDVDEGRSIALGIDGGWLLQFSEFGARTAGRGHGALWDGLLGWLMRDPRFEPGQFELPGGCIAGFSSVIKIASLPRSTIEGGVATLDVTPMGHSHPPIHLETKVQPANGDGVEWAIPPLAEGGYTATFRMGGGIPSRRDFACELGGDEWADSRPDPERLRAVANASHGTFRWADDTIDEIPLPKPTVVSAERHVVPIVPPWVWTLCAAAALGTHWVARRRRGLA